MKKVCGCGEAKGLREIVMSDSLWEQFFATPDSIRPPSVWGCRTCIVDWQRYAAPLIEVPGERSAWLAQTTFPKPEEAVVAPPVGRKVLLTVGTNKSLHGKATNVEILFIDEETNENVFHTVMSAEQWWDLCTGKATVVTNTAGGSS
jgi:hypothetical protein